MRVSDSMFFSRMRTALLGRRSDLAEAQQRAETGFRVQQPSDDPLASAMARKQTATEQRFAAYERGVDDTSSKLANSDSVLDQVHDELVRAHDLSIQAANDTLTAGDRQTINDEIVQIQQHVISLANTDQGGHYLFAGYKDNAPPFDATGTYTGGTVNPQIEAAPGVMLTQGITGDQVFAPAGGINVMTALASLSTALTTNNYAGIQQAIDDLNTGAGQIADTRAQLGALMQSADTAKAVAQRAQDSAVKRRSDLIEIDPAVAYTDVTKAQSALQAAVAIAGQLPPAGLVNSPR